MITHGKAVAKKAAKMKHYIRDGIIWLNYYVDGKRYRKSTRLHDTKENLEVVKTKIIPALQTKIATGEIYKTKPKTFRYYGGIFLKSKESNRTYHLKSPYFQRVIDYFGDRNIDEITRLDIKQYLNSLDMKSKSKNDYKSCTSQIFELAVDDGVIDNNPALNIKLKADRREEVQYYTRDEVGKILSVAQGIIRPYLYIAFNTGMRSGEILGLQLGDFKDDGYIHIRRSRTKGMICNGKNYNAIRKVPYPIYILDEVRSIKSNNLFLFGDIDDSSGMRYQWERVCSDAGVKRHKLYSTRHTFATLMLKEKVVSINELAGLLGHSTPKVTLQHYASVIKADSNSLNKDFSLFRHVLDTVEKEKDDKAL